MKKLLVSILMLGLMFNVSCTSKNDTDTDQETASTDPAQDLEGAQAAQSTDSMETSKDDFAADEEVIADTGEEVTLADDEKLPDDSLAVESKGAEGEEVVLSDDAASKTSSELSGSETADGSVSSDITTEDSTFDSSVESTPSTDIADTASVSETPETPKPNYPLQKIKDAPYSQGGVLLNAVYIGRKGDTVSSVAMKIFGSNKSQDLKAANSFLNRREVKIGDKIYYNSPKRPQDAERMLTFYEDNGIPAQSYVAKSGDNIRKVSKNLLGHKDSWKEVWATNLAVESKGDLTEGTELRYWNDSAANKMPLAEAAPAPEISEPTPAPAPEPVAQNTVPAPDDFSMPDDFNNNGAAGTIAAEPPPPPPPPPTLAASKQVASSGDKDMTFMLSAGGLLLVGVGIMLAVMRKSRSRKMSMNTNTQI